MGPDRHPFERGGVAWPEFSFDHEAVARRRHGVTIMQDAGGGLGRAAEVHPGVSVGSSRPSASARATASARDVAPSLRYSSRVWLLTVFSEM